MTMQRLFPALLAVLAALLVAGCGSGDDSSSSATPQGSQGGSRAANPHPVAGDFKPNGTTLADCAPGESGFQTCLEQGYGNLAYDEGPKVALARFAGAIDSDPAVERGCHRIAHTIGSATLARDDGDVGRAFSEGDSTCWSGYYHGILERALKGATEETVLVARIRALCSDVIASQTSFVSYQCVHGLGHGLMIRTGLDLPYSLEMCTRLETEWEQTSCDGGVFMENFNTSYGVKSRYLKDDQPLYPCPAVQERHKMYCYLQVTDRILQLNNYDMPAAARTCLDAEPGWEPICFQSYGRSASGTSRLDRDLLVSFCEQAPPVGRSDCVYGAVRDIVSNDAGGRRALGFCKAVRAPLRGRCYNGLGTILNNLGQLQQCSLVPAAYRQQCRLERTE